MQQQVQQQQQPLTTTTTTTSSTQSILCSDNSNKHNNKNNKMKKKMKKKKKTFYDFNRLFYFDDNDQIYEVDHNNNSTTLPSSSMIPEYPFISQSLLHYCNLSNIDDDTKPYITNAIQIQRPTTTTTTHSLAYIKPHKTGSTTVAGIVNRIVYGRNLIKMIPEDKSYLGWPDIFPGGPNVVVGMADVMQQHTKYDAITNHAVYSNRTHYLQYLHHPMSVFTILRDPLARTISGYNYFQHADIDSWATYIRQVKTMTKIKNWKDAVNLNNLAFSLGWYHQPYINGTTSMDHNDTLIEQFISFIDEEFDHVMILENLVESLVLLKDLALPELSITELIWYDYDNDIPSDDEDDENDNVDNNKETKKKKKVYPTTKEKQELYDLLYLDRMIYNHFKEKLHNTWKRRVQETPELIDLKNGLQCLHDTIVDRLKGIDNENDVDKQNVQLSEKLMEYMTLPAVQYTRVLRRRQVNRYGCTKLSKICPN